MKIEELNLSNRTYNSLKRAKINNVEDINPSELLKVKGIGYKTFLEIDKKMKVIGLWKLGGALNE